MISLEFLDVTSVSQNKQIYFSAVVSQGGGIPKRSPLLRRQAVFSQTSIEHCLLVCP